MDVVVWSSVLNITCISEFRGCKLAWTDNWCKIVLQRIIFELHNLDWLSTYLDKHVINKLGTIKLFLGGKLFFTFLTILYESFTFAPSKYIFEPSGVYFEPIRGWGTPPCPNLCWSKRRMDWSNNHELSWLILWETLLFVATQKWDG